jgi:hypothetical protein
MPVAIYRHDGDWTEETRENRSLRYIEHYILDVEMDTRLLYPNRKYYSSDCVFRDTTDVTYVGADAIHDWMLKLFAPFSKVTLEGLSFQVVDESEGEKSKYTVNAEFQVKYFLHADPEPIFAPRLFVFTIENADSPEAWDGLQFTKVLLYWNPALVGNEVKRRAAAKETEQSSKEE